MRIGAARAAQYATSRQSGVQPRENATQPRRNAVICRLIFFLITFLSFPDTQLYKFACQFVQNSLKNNSNHSLLKFTHSLLHKLVKRNNFKYNTKLLENCNIKSISATLGLKVYHLPLK